YDEIDIQIIKKPFLLKDLINKIEYLNQKENLNSRTSLNFKIPLIDKTNKTKIIFDSIHKIINNNLNALVSGENGTGKRQIANTVNALREPGKKLLEINFLDYKNNNFEKLLLNKISKDEFLNSKFIKSSDVSKTILLTDIETMPLNVQNLLLSILKSKNASSLLISNKTKFIATSSKNMKQILSNNNFSSELFYFLSMYNIFTLSLRERKEDIKILVMEIIAEFNLANKQDKILHEDAYPLLEDYIWPGNLTQLKNFLKRCYDFSNNISIKSTLIKQEINNEFKYANKDYLENWKINFNNFISANIRGFLSNNKVESGLYYKLIKEFEKPLIVEILKYTNNNKLLSSQLLGINRNTLRKKMEDYEIEIIKNTTSRN
ncbi:MAG: sigma 54-interacting transcriptional regulator, partial [Pseudomonadota bacterium]|nr:sigma 54-interacting transcriptional regulator [Pseudomonadota bacterium]